MEKSLSLDFFCYSCYNTIGEKNAKNLFKTT
jgi:hypothetical protein